MKKSYILICLALLVFLSACGVTQNASKDSNKPTAPADEKYTAADYFPFEPNTELVYEGIGNEYAAFTSWCEFINGDRAQFKTNNGGTEAVEVIERTQGRINKVFGKGEIYYRSDFTGASQDKPETLLAEPLITGTTWILPDGRVRHIEDTSVTIETPAGKFNCIKVVTDGPDDSITDYYAPKTGMVKSVFSSNGTEVTSILKEIRKVARVQSVRFYYPNMNDDKIYYEEKQITYNTGDTAEKVLEQAYKTVPSGLSRVLTKNVKINSIKVNDSYVTVDFSKSLVTEMNAGSGYEGAILQSITDTIGVYFQTEKVEITLDGTTYASGHFEMKAGETFSVRADEAAEYKAGADIKLT